MSTLHQKLEEEQREAAARGKKSMCQNAVDGVTKCFTENKPKVEHLCGDLKRRGACTKFGEFTKNLFLIRPLGRMKNAQELVAELRGSITLSPEFPLKGFVLWNEIAFWIGVLSQVVGMLLGDPLLTSSLYIVAGYLTAYFFFWVFAYSNDKWYQRITLIFCMCLTIYYAFSAIGGIFKISPLLFDGSKAFATAVMCIHARKVFNKTPADSNGSASDPAVDALRLI